MRRDRQTDRHTDGQKDTHMTKLKVVFRNFANAPKKNGKRLSSSSPVVMYICSGCHLITCVCGFENIALDLSSPEFFAAFFCNNAFTETVQVS